MTTARTHIIHNASEEHQSRALGGSARNASNSTTLASSSGKNKKGWISRTHDFFLQRPPIYWARISRPRPRPRGGAGLVDKASYEADGPRQR